MRPRSRTVVSRTFAKVRSRISSISSMISQGSDTLPASRLIPDHSSKTESELVVDSTQEHSALLPVQRSNPASEGRLPQISTLVITSSTWTIFANPSYPNYTATAYVQFTVGCKALNAQKYTSSTVLLNNAPGILLNLSLERTITGTHTVLQDFTQYAIPCLEPDGTWLCLVHLGFNETSLASKLATSWKSLRTRTAKSLKRCNMETIDRWLAVLSADQERDGTKNGPVLHEDVTVKIKLRYQQSLLPHEESGTWLEDQAECKVKLRENGCWGPGGRLDGVLDEEAFGRGSSARTCDEGEEDMMEEMVKEYNVIVGPPFML